MEARYLDAISAARFKEAAAQALIANLHVFNREREVERMVSAALASSLFYQYREVLCQEYLATQKALSLLDSFISSLVSE